MITIERPGFGISTRLPGRGYVEPVDDVVAILDELAIEAAPVIGGSGGGPHVLALCARHPERVTAAAIVVGLAPLNAPEEHHLIPLNREGVALARSGDWEGMRRLLQPERDRILRDPIAGFRATMATAPPADQEIMSDPAWQEGAAIGLREALRAGVEGWVDESMLMGLEWTDFDPRSVTTSVVWWHGDGDRNCPLTAAQRVASVVPAIELRVWDNAGHLTPYRNEPAILDDLLSRAA
jgi:pimeloyl-ACP methyl ester carboxylesterase